MQEHKFSCNGLYLRAAATFESFIVKTALFAWELGRGLGHVMNIRRVAARLKAHGVKVIAAVSDPAAAGHLGDVADDVVTAPAWPFATRPDVSRGASSATLNDILASAGLADAAAVQRLLLAWDDLFAQVRPDLLVAEFSPLAAVAARGRIPVVWMGNGFTVPPHEMRRFPLLHRVMEPMWKEEATLDAVNTALSATKRQPLECLPQLFAGDAHLIYAFPVLDPYDTQRVGPVDGPLLDRLPEPRRDDAQSVFAYLSSGYQPHPSVFDALRPLAAALRIHAPKLSSGQLAELRALGAQVDAIAPPLHDVLPQARLVVHNGGSGVASEALLAGVPQVVLSAQIEQDLNGAALQRAGVARLVRTHEPGLSLSPELLRDAMADPALLREAADMAVYCRDFAKAADAPARSEDVCLRLLQVR